MQVRPWRNRGKGIGMKAIVCAKYGPPGILELMEVEKPVPGEGEVLVRIFASCVNTQNVVLASGKPFFVRLMGTGILAPGIRIPGNDFAGVVESVGGNVKGFRSGDEVFGDLSACGHGAYAEYARVPERALVRKPAGTSFEEAAGAAEAATVALQGLRDKGGIRAGQKVLIFGASGGIGSFAVQIAKCFGAEVTGVCGAGNLDLVRSLGADHVIDYSKEDYSGSGRSYDLIFAIANLPVSAHLRALGPGGTYVSTGSPSMKRIFQDMVRGPLLLRKGDRKMAGGWSAAPNPKDLGFIKGLMEAGKVRTVIDRRYALGETAEAFRYYARGHSRGKVVISVGAGGGK
jgi:NADPH:quinone reductase-like Zn-dependent oxidoreductase